MVRSINSYGHFVVFAMSIIVLVAKTAESAPAVDCSSLALTMADCLSFVTSGSTVQKPEGNCCPGLKTTLKTDASCLCEGFKNSAQLGVTLNVSKALTLPAACHVSAPSISNCGRNTFAFPFLFLPSNFLAGKLNLIGFFFFLFDAVNINLNGAPGKYLINSPPYICI